MDSCLSQNKCKVLAVPTRSHLSYPHRLPLLQLHRHSWKKNEDLLISGPLYMLLLCPWFIHSIVWVPIILFKVTYHKQMEKESCPCHCLHFSNVCTYPTPLAQLCWPPDLKQQSFATTPLFHIPLSSFYLVTPVPFWYHVIISLLITYILPGRMQAP